MPYKYMEKIHMIFCIVIIYNIAKYHSDIVQPAIMKLLFINIGLGKIDAVTIMTKNMACIFKCHNFENLNSVQLGFLKFRSILFCT